MLWAYFDESGEHDRETGHLRRLTLGGCIAPLDAWQRLDAEWNSALVTAGIKMFHMTDFERYRGEFEGWDKEKHNRMLNCFLEIIGRHIRHCFGFTTGVGNGSPKTFSAHYEDCLVDCLVHVANASAQKFKNEISVVFAKQRDFRPPRIERYFDLINFGDSQLASVTFDEPISNRPLQVADIIAYEVQHIQRDDSREDRYPLKRLQQLGCRFRFSGGF
jgi:hypothetical protein